MDECGGLFSCDMCGRVREDERGVGEVWAWFNGVSEVRRVAEVKTRLVWWDVNG